MPKRVRKKNYKRSNEHAYLKKFQGYRFVKKDPAMEAICCIIEDSGMTTKEISEASGVSVSTIHNWMYGETRRPQHITLEFVARACGKQFKLSNYTGG